MIISFMDLNANRPDDVLPIDRMGKVTALRNCLVGEILSVKIIQQEVADRQP